MKKILTTLIFLSLIVITNAQIGIQTNTPDASAALDIVATDKGLLIPRVTLTNDLTIANPVTAPATGLLVFNTGANQPVGLYYWNGSAWNIFNVGLVNADYWNVKGNAGTTVGTNFIGTTDAEDFAVYTANSERMRFTSGGQGLVGLTTPYYAEDFVTIEGNATQNYALNVYSPYTGIFTAGVRGIYASAVDYGLISVSDTTGIYTSGEYYGLRSYSNNSDRYSIYAKNLAVASYGAVIVGSNRAGYTLTDRNCGVSSQGDDGFFTLGQNSDGIGVIAGGNGLTTVSTIATGAGGAFTGYHGIYGSAVNASVGVGVIGVGNDHGTYNTTTSGSGGAFTGYHGLISTAYNANGTGVIGVGNGGGYSTLIGGSGGAFTGDVCGVYGRATNTSGDRYGGYFSSGGNINPSGVGYAYVGGRFSGTQAKIIGTGNVSTIVKNTNGELITLTCPEAPEVVFQDYGIGHLVNGFAHISIDRDLAININVNESHPLKVFITLEGDCNGVYVTNKSAEGFDVIELQGGNSNVPFSWQIVATRADEVFTLMDGSKETSVNSKRFAPAPGPLDVESEASRQNSIIKVEAVSTTAVELKDQEIKQEELKLQIKGGIK